MPSSPLRPAFRRPPVLASVLAFLTLALLCGLGTWQIKRAHWKADLLARLDAAAAQDPMSHALNAEIIAQAHDFERGFVHGVFLNDLEITLGPRTHDGEPGYHVLTPFRLDDGGLLFINRGWVPIQKQSRNTRPDTLVSGPVSIPGMLRTPVPGGMFVPENNPAQDLWFQYDLPAMASARNLPPPLPMVFYQEKTIGPSVWPIPEAALSRPPDNHRLYALFWFSMAGILVLMFFLRFIRFAP